MPVTVKVPRTATLKDIESLIASLTGNAAEVELWLPRKFKACFFLRSWLTSLIALCSRSGTTTLIDWSTEQDLARTRDRFTSTVEGLAAALYSNRIVNAAKQPFAINGDELRWSVIENEGILPSASPARDFTICAIDDDEPADPVTLMALQTKESFVAEFELLRSNYLKSALGREGTDLFTQEPYNILGGFVFEIYRNTIAHGCKDVDGNPIKGIRYVRLQKHIDTSPDGIINRANSFPELRTYLDDMVSGSPQPPFYEVSISDHGEGIIKRFLATRPDVQLDEDSIEGRVRLVNRIITEALSSNQGVSGAGHGLERALAAVDELSGFVTVRTDRLWLYYARSNGAESSPPRILKAVQAGRDIAPTVGTHFNLVFPLP